MQVDSTLETELRDKFASMRATMPERNVKQATLIPSAQAIPNPVGTAPGWWVEKDNHIIVAMPGVPREMYRMWEDEVIPRLSSHTGSVIFTRILRVAGLGESSVEEKLGALIHSTNPTLATYAKNDAIDVRVTAKAATQEEAVRQVDEMDVQVRQILGQAVFGTNKDTLASVIGDLMQSRNQSLGVMESLTGGLLSSTLTDVKSSSKHFIGGVVSYSTDLKEQMGVPKETLEQYGVISEQTARAMAHAIRVQLSSDFGVGITGVAGPDTQEGQPVGTVYMAVEGPMGVVTAKNSGRSRSREDNKRVAVLAVLNLLRRFLEGTVKPE